MLDSLQTVMKPSLHYNEEPYNKESCPNLGPKTVNHHSMYPDLFIGSHLLIAQKPIGMIAQRSEYYALLDVVRGLHAIRNREFVLINQRQSNNLGFQTVHA